MKSLVVRACVATWAAIGGAMGAHAAEAPVKIGVMTDLAGVLSSYQGPGAVLGAQMAIEDFGGKVLGQPIGFVSADYQNKPDIGSALARQWYERDGVDLIVGAENSAVALAVMQVAKKDDRILIVTGGAAMAITNEQCNDRTINWGFDSYALANGSVSTLIDQGFKDWYFVVADYAYGHSVRDVASRIIKEKGGKVVGSINHPLNTLDFSSFLLQAQASGASVIGLASAGADTVNTIKQAAEYKISPKQKLAGLAVFITDIHSLGLPVAQGTVLTTGFYWDRTDATRAWARRFFERYKAMPTVVQAANYSAVTHYLKAVQAAGTKDPAAVMAQMKKMPVNDFFAQDGLIRDDGRMIHDMYLMEVKSPADSKYPWDYYKPLSVIPRDKAFQPLSMSTCPLVTQKK